MKIVSRIKSGVVRQDTLARHMVDFNTDAIGILAQHVVIAGRPMAFLRRCHNMGTHFPQQCVDPVDVFA